METLHLESKRIAITYCQFRIKSVEGLTTLAPMDAERSPSIPGTSISVSTESSSGTLDLQTATTAPAKGYAFAVNGTDIVPQPLAMGGILNIDSPNKISGTGSVADEDDAGTVTPNSTVS